MHSSISCGSRTDGSSRTGDSSGGSRRSRPDRSLAVIACGALAGPVRDIVARRGWPVEVRPLPAVLHNRPERIAPAVAELAATLQARGLRVALGYADCGSYGALDELCARLGITRLRGLHCYDVLGGAGRVRALLAREPGTYLLTDYLVRSFETTVLAGLGLDRHPELWADYFGRYRRLVWLAQDRTAALEKRAFEIAGMFGLPLRIIDVGTGSLERELELMVSSAAGASEPGGRERARIPARAVRRRATSSA
jgi:Protein of unknown function (DUF1638)